MVAFLSRSPAEPHPRSGGQQNADAEIAVRSQINFADFGRGHIGTAIGADRCPQPASSPKAIRKLIFLTLAIYPKIENHIPKKLA